MTVKWKYKCHYIVYMWYRSDYIVCMWYRSDYIVYMWHRRALVWCPDAYYWNRKVYCKIFMKLS